jgi:hypothetical protein
VDVNLADAGEDVFAGKSFRQHLSLYDALMTATAGGVTARVVAWPRRDVIAVEIDDQREHPAAVNVDLRMLRYAIQNVPGKNYELAKSHTVEIHTAEHTAASHLDIREGRIVLTQTFTEHDHYSASAVTIAAVGRESKARYLNESTVQLSAAPGRGKVTFLIASAASLKRDQDVEAIALAELDAAAPKGFSGLAADTADSWHDFWSRGFVYLHSPDGQADFVEQNYTYFLYLMGASSRGGAFPPRFGGMLWYTNGDMRRWGSQYWWANTAAYYSNLMPANRLELMDPMFDMYSGMLDSSATAARQQWGAQGIWIPEISFFNGPEKLPDDIAAELQDLVLARKPYDQHSDRFQWWAETKNRHNARWNFLGDGHWEHGHYVVPTKGAGIFGHCTHILCDAARIGKVFYDRYLFTGDETWLRERAYPVIRGAAEFYRTFPNVRRGDDGRYHIDHVNNNESGWDSSDPPMEITGMRTAFTTAIAAATKLNVDADLRPKWQEMLDHLAEPRDPGRGKRPAMPTGGDAGTPGGTAPAGPPASAGGPSSSPSTRPRDRADRNADRPFAPFVYGGPGAIPPNEPDAKLKSRFLGFTALGSFIDVPGIGGAQIFRNRMRLREGPGAIDAEHIGGLTAGVHSTLLDSTPDAEGNQVIETMNRAWPPSWDCAFELLARGGFVVTASYHAGAVEWVRVRPTIGGPCRIKTPWPGKPVTLRRGDGKTESLAGDTLDFGTTRDRTILLLPGDSASDPAVRSIPQAK